MIEWKKIWKRKKLLGILAFLLILQVFQFLYFTQDNGESAEFEEQWDIEMTSVSEISKSEQFKDNIQAIIAQTDSMNSVSIFTQTDSFSYKNLQKTKEDYEALLAVEPIDFDDEFFTEFLNDRLLNGILVLCGLLIAVNLVDENKVGLKCMIFATSGGRGKLALQKTGALLLWDALLTVLFYGSTLVVSAIRFGGDLMGCLKYPIQSIDLLAMLPWPISIGEFLAVYFFYRFLILSAISMIVLVIFFCIYHPLLSTGLTGLIAIANYLTGTQIEAYHPLALFRYCSLWYLMNDSSFFTEYRNLDLFHSAVNKNTIVFTEIIIIIVLFILVTLFIGVKRYPCPSSSWWFRKLLLKAGTYLQHMYGAVLEKLSILGSEFFKVLFSQRGILVIAIFFVILIHQSDFSSVLKSGEVELYYSFMDEFAGLPSEASAQYISDLSEKLDAIEAEYLEAEEKYLNGEISQSEYMDSYFRYDAFESDRQFLANIESQTAYLADLKESRGIDGWYINRYTYNNLLSADNTLSDILLIFAVVLLCSGIFAREKICGILPVMRASTGGRSVLFRRKIGMAMGITLFLYLFSSILTIASVISKYGMETLNAPVQSLESLMFIPFQCSMSVFIVSLYLLRGMILLAVAAFTSMLSVKMGQKIAVAVSFVLCVPSLLTLVGIHFMQYLSIIRILSIVPFLLQVQNVGIVAAVCAVFLALGTVSMVNGYKKWCVTS